VGLTTERRITETTVIETPLRVIPVHRPEKGIKIPKTDRSVSRIFYDKRWTDAILKLKPKKEIKRSGESRQSYSTLLGLLIERVRDSKVYLHRYKQEEMIIIKYNDRSLSRGRRVNNGEKGGNPEPPFPPGPTPHDMRTELLRNDESQIKWDAVSQPQPP